MRYTVPWLPPPPTREPRDDDELTGYAIELGLFVGILARRYGKRVSAEVLAMAMSGLFDSALRLDDADLITVMSGAVMLARAMGLVDVSPDGWVEPTETPLSRDGVLVLRAPPRREVDA